MFESYKIEFWRKTFKRKRQSYFDLAPKWNCGNKGRTHKGAEGWAQKTLSVNWSYTKYSSGDKMPSKTSRTMYDWGSWGGLSYKLGLEIVDKKCEGRVCVLAGDYKWLEWKDSWNESCPWCSVGTNFWKLEKSKWIVTTHTNSVFRPLAVDESSWSKANKALEGAWVTIMVTTKWG